jgi:hypothetical protein
MNPDGTYKNPAFGLYRAMVPAPNQNFLSPNQQPTNNFYPRGRTRSAAQRPVQRPHRLQPVDELPVLLPRQRQQVRGVVAVRLDLRLAGSQVRGPARRLREPVQLVGDRHVDEGLKSSTVIDTQLSGNRAFQRDTRKNTGQLHADVVGLPSYLDDFCRRASSASCRKQLSIGTQAWAARSTAGFGSRPTRRSRA